MGPFTFLSLGFLAVFFSLSGAEGYRCPADWHPKNGLCYKAFPELKTWLDAELFCRNYKTGCHLASLHSKVDSADMAWFISDYFKGHGHIWIGLRDTSKKRTWQWSDGSSTNYCAWNSGEPNNQYNREYCVHLWAPSGYLKWNDADCRNLHPFLCQCKF